MSPVKEGPLMRLLRGFDVFSITRFREGVSHTVIAPPVFFVSTNYIGPVEYLADGHGDDFYAEHRVDSSVEYFFYRVDRRDLSVKAQVAISPADIGEADGEGLIALFSVGQDNDVYSMWGYNTNSGIEYIVRMFVLDGQTLAVKRTERVVAVSETTNNINTVVWTPPIQVGDYVYHLYGYDGGPEDFRQLGVFINKVAKDTLTVVQTEFLATQVWNNSFISYDFAASPDGYLYFANNQEFALGNNEYEYRVTLHKIDAETLSTQRVDLVAGDSDNHNANSVACDAEGNVYVSYDKYISYLNYDSYVAKYDTNLNLVWETETRENPLYFFVLPEGLQVKGEVVINGEVETIDGTQKSGVLVDDEQFMIPYDLETGRRIFPNSAFSVSDVDVNWRVTAMHPSYFQRIGLMP